MTTAAPTLDREEYVEQAYFFRTLRERMTENLAAQDVLSRLHEEMLTTTRLPYAVQFLAAELRHTGLMAPGFAKLPHYFTRYQTFVVRQSEQEKVRFTTGAALLVLEREATYKASDPTPAGLFVYQFEALARNRLGYNDGLDAMAADPHYGPDWRGYIDMVRRQVGAVDFADLVYLRSAWYVTEQRRTNPAYEPPVPAIFGEKEGRIAKASRGRDPLFLFAALQRQLGYPEVPRPRPREDVAAKFDGLSVKIRDLETRVRLMESEMRGNVDLSQFGKPDILKDDGDDVTGAR